MPPEPRVEVVETIINEHDEGFITFWIGDEMFTLTEGTFQRLYHEGAEAFRDNRRSHFYSNPLG